MIQRLQTIFLLIAAILMGLTLVSPLSILGADGIEKIFIFKPIGVMSIAGTVFHTWGVFAFAIIGLLLPLLNIFLYKKRKLQIKLCTATSLMLVLFYVTFYVYLNSLMLSNNLVFLKLEYGIILPLISIVMNVLAMLSIKKDEKLVQSLNRIR